MNTEDFLSYEEPIYIHINIYKLYYTYTILCILGDGVPSDANGWIQMSGWEIRHGLLSPGGCLSPSMTEEMACAPVEPTWLLSAHRCSCVNC